MKIKYHYIYKTTCIITNKYYIGMHSTFNINDGYIGSGKRLKYSINKYGIENHICEKLEFFSSREELVNREIEIINENLLQDDMCINLALGGDGGNGSKFLSKEQLVKGGKYSGNLHSYKMKTDMDYRNKSIEVFNNNKKEYLSDEENKKKWFDKVSWFGRKHTDKSIDKMKESKKNHGIGSTNSQYGTCWITNEIENKKIKKDDPIPDGWRLGRKIK